MTSLQRISAGVVWPISSPPIANGAILVEDGQVAAVGRDAAVPRPEQAVTTSHPDAVLLPGLINLHTHLELTGLRGMAFEDSFFRWIQQVRRRKEDISQDGFLEAAKAGLREAWQHGTTTIADTGTSGATVQALEEMEGRGVFYQEVIAPKPEQSEAAFAALTSTVERLRYEVPSSVRIGISPHAPYTVSAELFRRVLEFARQLAYPMASHIAESRAEVELVTVGRGAFADDWRARGIKLPQVAPSAVQYVDRLGLFDGDLLAIHVVRVDDDDLQILARHDVAVAVCLGSNRRHRHGLPPLSALLAAGVRVGLGTDSVASVPSLDLLAEARAARDLAELDAENALRLLTVGGARALGMEAEIGSLAQGMGADLCVIRLEDPASHSREGIAEAVLGARQEDVVGTYVAGRLVHEASESPRA